MAVSCVVYLKEFIAILHLHQSTGTRFTAISEADLIILLEKVNFPVRISLVFIEGYNILLSSLCRST